MDFLKNVTSTVAGNMITAILVLFVVFAGADSTFAKEKQSMWGYGNINTGEVMVILEMDLEDEELAKMMVEMSEIAISEVLSEGYTELPNFFVDIAGDDIKFRSTEELQESCRVFYGYAPSISENAFGIVCHKDESIFMTMTNLDDGEALYKLTESVLMEDSRKDWILPKGFIEVPM